MRSTFLIIIIINLTLGAGCIDNPASYLETRSDFLVPLKIGNSWIYRLEIYDFDSGYVRTEVDTSKIIGDTIIDGERWYFKTGEGAVANMSGGYFYTHHPYPELKYPATVGDTFQYEGNNLRTLQSVFDTVGITRQSLKVYKYKQFNKLHPEAERSYFYMAPGIGELKFEIVLGPADSPLVWIRRELISYELY